MEKDVCIKELLNMANDDNKPDTTSQLQLQRHLDEERERSDTFERQLEEEKERSEKLEQRLQEIMMNAEDDEKTLQVIYWEFVAQTRRVMEL